MAVLGQVATKAFPQLTITQSQTWVPPQDGNVCIHVVGAGGGGIGYYGVEGRRGGGAGAYAKVPTLAVTTSGSYALVVGVGGNGSTSGTAAGTGGSSTIAGTGLTGTKTCSGGAGAYTSVGAGGTVSGSGQSWAGYAGGAGNYGGGAVGIFATGQAAGTATGHGGMTDAQSGGMGMSGFGIICGGSKKSHNNFWNASAAGSYNTDTRAGDLCGGGMSENSTISNKDIRGADGGLGGGGGGCRSASSGFSFGGDGGDGIILIQYLPW